MAAIDCGTNSTRLLVADSDGSQLLRLSRITRLGKGVDGTGALAGDAIARTLDVLTEYRAEMERLGVVNVRVSATSAARDASNRADFFAPAAQIIGFAPELLSGSEEGRLAFAGATADLDSAIGPYVVADIGGGSTEVVLGFAGHDPIGAISLDVGCVRLTERCLGHDPPLPAELKDAEATVRLLLDKVIASMPGVVGAPVLVGLAGTITTLAAIELGTTDRNATHHSVLSRAKVRDLLDRLATTDPAERLEILGLEPARADVIVGGAVVLATLLDYLDIGECLVSEADILDGLVMSLVTGRSESIAEPAPGLGNA
ncbi:MAG: exopolyphosphatase [Acidimicrobiales bacterium]